MGKVIAFDLDDCLCSRPKDKEHLGGGKYEYCYPINDMVDIVNKLYDEGHYIKIYTARGMTTYSGDVAKIYEELFDLTTKHLNEWGIKYNELIMGKTHYDLLIDDKAVNSIGITYEKIINMI